MAIIVKCKRCDNEIVGKASLLVIPVSTSDVPDGVYFKFLDNKNEDLVRKIHLCNDCVEEIEDKML